MPNAQIILVTTPEIGPAGPIRKIFAVGTDTPEAALDLVQATLRGGENARWLEARSLNVSENEVRLI